MFKGSTRMSFRPAILIWGVLLTLLVAWAGEQALGQTVQAAQHGTKKPAQSAKKPGKATSAKHLLDDSGNRLAHLNYAKILHLLQGQTVEKVIVADLEHSGSKQAVVLVRNDGTGQILDWYIFAIVAGHPQQVFTRRGLYKGSVEALSGGIILSDEVDPNSPINRNRANAFVVQDLHKEYRWFGGVFGQATFPGFYPALTRRETLAIQGDVLKGNEPFLLNPRTTAQHAAQRLFGLTVPASGIIITQRTTTTATVVVNKTATYFLRRLVRLDSKGVWSLIAVRTGAISIATPLPLGHTTGAVHLTGKANVFEGALNAALIDHTYHALLRTHFQATSGTGTPGTYSTTLPYHLTAPGQDTLILVYSLSARDGSFQDIATVKVLLF